MSKILLKNIILNNSESEILITNNIIEKIGKKGEIQLIENEAVEIFDCKGKTAMPAFVNMHTHAAMSLMRGMEEDVPFRDWLENIWQIEKSVDYDFVYHGTKVAGIEMIKTGTATFNDQYWFSPAAYKASSELGIRPALSYVILDQFDKNQMARQKEQCIEIYEEGKKWENAIQSIAFHAIYSVSEEMMVWTSEFAKKHNLNLHIHLSETKEEVENCKKEHKGLSPVEYLETLGVLNDKLIAAHTLWLSDKDIELLGKYKVNCVHNINSNTKLTSGYKFKYNELRDAGANVCIGTDGCASSNNLDVLEAMKTSALVQKAWRDDPKAMPMGELLSLATINGAKALGINSGVIEEGKLADIMIVDTNSSFFLSPATFLANFIYSTHSDCVDTMIINGKFVMKNRIVKGEEETLNNAKKILTKLKR